MGNSNGREDGLGSPADFDEDGSGDGAVDNNELLEASLPPPEAMAHSPPYSPRAIQSPLMFTPQVSSFAFCYSVYVFRMIYFIYDIYIALLT